MPKKTYITFYNGWNYDYCFIIKKLLEQFKQIITCLEENTGKYITFSGPIGKEVTKTDKNGEEITKNISYILQFIDTARFMRRSLSIFVNIFLKEFIKLNI